MARPKTALEYIRGVIPMIPLKLETLLLGIVVE